MKHKIQLIRRSSYLLRIDLLAIDLETTSVQSQASCTPKPDFFLPEVPQVPWI